MDFHRITSRVRLLEDLRKRLQAIQTRNPSTKPDPQKLKTFRGLTLVFLSIFLGWISLQASETSSIGKYRLRTWPSKLIWHASLSSRGLVLKTNLGEHARLLRQHPDPFSGQSSIWVSPDGCAVYLPASPYSEHTSELWTCEPNPRPPSQWLQAGSGLDGFEKLMVFLEKTLKKPPANVPPRLNLIDPKEIRY